MMKRSFAMLLAVVMVLSMLPMSIWAEGQSTAEKNTAYTAPLAQHNHAASGDSHICEHCVQAGKTGAAAVPEWKPWDSTKSYLPNEAGHWYLTGDMYVNVADVGSADVVICLNGYTVTARKDQRFFTLKKDGVLTVLDCTAKTVTPEGENDSGYRAGKLTGAANAAAIMFENATGNNAQLYWYDGILTANNKGTACVMSVQQQADVHMYGGEISNNVSTSNACIYLAGSGNTFEAENVNFYNNAAAGNGGVITCNANSVIELKSCVFYGNSAKNGGVIYGKNGSNSGYKLTATDCVFKNNTAAEYAGALYNRGGYIKAYGCSFEGNTAKNYSAIFGYGGGIQITLGDCTVTKNVCTDDDGAIRIPNSGCGLILQGKTVIYGNTRKSTGEQANIYLPKDGGGNHAVVKLGTGGLAAGSKIGIKLPADRLEASKVLSTTLGGALTRAQVLEYFYADNTGYMVDLVGDKLELTQGHVHTAHLEGCSVADCKGHENSLYLPLTKDMTFPTSGSYYLAEEYTLKGDVALSTGTLNLCLNGQTLKLDGKRFNISGDGVLNITDCKNKTENNVYSAGKITGGTNSVFTMAGGTVNIYEGIITENNRPTYHASVAFVEKKATFNLYGGEISNNTAGADGSSRGGTIYLQDNTVTFNMYGGKITGNSAVNNGTYGGKGAAVFSRDAGTVNILGGEISNNTAANQGGAIYAKGGKVTVKNAKITGNTAKLASAIYGAGSGVQITVDGAEITGNRTTGTGVTYGAIYTPNNGSRIIVQGAAKITGNTGGDVYLVKDSNTTSPNHTMVTLGTAGLADSARISITMPADRFAAEPHASLVLGGKLTEAQVLQIFSCSDGTQEVVLEQDRLLVREAGAGHKHCVCGVEGCTAHDQIKCLPWSSTDSLPTDPGSYYLEKDVRLTVQPKLSTGTVNLCLNGKTVTVVQRLEITGDAVLNITDCQAKTENGVYTAGKFTGAGADVFHMTGSASGKKSYVNLYQGILTGNNRNGYQAAVAFLQNGATLNMYGGEISGNSFVSGSEDRGGMIYISNDTGTFNLYGGVIRNNQAKKSDAGKGGHGGVVYSNKGTVNLLGGEISGNTAAGNGGAVYAYGGTLNMAGTKLLNNTAATGGAIYATEGAKITDNGSTISGNKANSSAAIYGKGGSLKLTGTKITGNEATTYSAINGAGGGIQITLDNVQITGNKATSAGVTYGAIYIPNSGAKIIVQGATKIADNEGGNVYLTRNSNAANPDEHSMITLGATGLKTGAKIGVTMPNDRMNEQPFASLKLNGALTDAQVAEYFFCDNSRYEITLKEDRLHIAKFYQDVGHKHCLCDDSVGACDHQSITWLAWDDPNELPTSGNYCLVVDVKTSANVSITGNDVLNLCLNGHTIEAGGKNQGTWQDRIFDIKENGTLNITDCTGEGKLTGGTYGVILFESNDNSKTTFNLFGGNIVNNKSISAGGAIIIQGSGTMNMYGGKISGNSMNGTAVVDASGNPVLNEDGSQKTTGTSNGGGAIGMIGAKTTFNMYGGEISDNECLATVYLDKEGKEAKLAGRGGAIYCTRGTVNIYGGRISGNRSYQGGAIYGINGAKLTIAGGAIAENKTDHHGAGIFADSAILTVSGGQITKNVSVKGAGGIQVSSGRAKLTVTGGEITENEGYYGGGIMCQGRAPISIEGGLIARNKADTAGGVYISTLSPAKMTGGVISENTAIYNGGGLYILRNVLNMTGGEISGNHAGSQGGGVYIYGATLNMENAVIKNNTARSGAGISSARLSVTGNIKEHTGINVIEVGKNLECRPTVNMLSGSIEGNNATGSGGGVLLQGFATLNVKSGDIKNNTAKGGGGGVYVSSNGTANIAGGNFTGNQSGGDGAGMYVGDKGTLEMTGGTFSGNKATGSGGGFYVMSAKANFAGGVIEKNTTKKQGAGVCGNRSDIKFSGVKVRNHYHTGTGSGYAGYVCNTTVSGGSITGNYSKNNGGGMFLQRGKLVVTGGSISYNSTDGAGGAIHARGIKTYFYGGYFAGNTCKKTGGGVLYVVRHGYKENGVQKEDLPYVEVHGGTYTDNSARNGGAMIIQSGAELKITGGTFTKNEGSANGGAIYISTNIKFDITGGTFTDNKTDGDGGAIDFVGCQGVVDGANGKLIFENNYAKRHGGSLQIGGGELVDITVKNVKLSGNSVGNRGGGMAVNTAGSKVNVDNVEICENHSDIQGGGFYIGHGPIVNVKNSKIHHNNSNAAGAGIATDANAVITMENVVVNNNETVTKGGGIYVRAFLMDMTNCQVFDNVANTDGGGVATAPMYGRGGEIGSGGDQPCLIMKNCKISGNTCVGAGGGMHANNDYHVTVTDCEISGNTSGLEGSGIWVRDDLKISGLTVTGNTSKSNGYAIFILDGAHDGQSFVQAIHEWGGDVIVKDNIGGEVYLGVVNAIASTAEGFGENTEFTITVDSGKLTNRLLGVYNYEQLEECVYKVTYGTRSMTEPEIFAQTGLASGDAVLYIGVGAFVVLAAAAVVVLVLLKKKKRSAAPAAEE